MCFLYTTIEVSIFSTKFYRYMKIQLLGMAILLEIDSVILLNYAAIAQAESNYCRYEKDDS